MSFLIKTTLVLSENFKIDKISSIMEISQPYESIHLSQEDVDLVVNGYSRCIVSALDEIPSDIIELVIKWYWSGSSDEWDRNKSAKMHGSRFMFDGDKVVYNPDGIAYRTIFS